jgi:hypothetical protein
MEKTDYSRIQLKIDEGLSTRFAPLFSKGVGVRARTGCSIEEFICGQLGISPEYLEERIQTIFLDGKPVDDYRKASIGDGSLLALSAAMPGLVGAVMRRGGYFASLRQTITYKADPSEISVQEGLVTVKLFNLTVRELGPVLLQQGILIEADDLVDVLTHFEASFRKGCQSIKFDGDAIDREVLLMRLANENIVHLRTETTN